MIKFILFNKKITFHRLYKLSLQKNFKLFDYTKNYKFTRLYCTSP